MNFRLPNKESRRVAMTLVEVMVTMALGSLVLAVVGTLIVFAARSFIALGNYSDLDQASRNALDILSKDIRQTKSLTYYRTNDLIFRDNDDQPLRYVWDPGARTLSRIKGTERRILLKECDFLRFGISQRNPSNSFNFYPAVGPATAKLVDVSWICSRQILQQKVNTESVQTAKIVIRN